MKVPSVIGLALLMAGVAAAAPAVTPQAIRQSIRDRGVRWMIDDFQKRGRWDSVTDVMDRGGAEWIALAPLLAGGSDAGSVEDLGSALAFALPKKSTHGRDGAGHG